MSRWLQRLGKSSRFSEFKSNDGKVVPKGGRRRLDTKMEIIIVKRPLPIELHLIMWLELLGMTSYIVVNAMLSVSKGYYGSFSYLHIALYSLFFLSMALYSFETFYSRRASSVISAVMFNVMLIMDTALGYMTGYDHCIGTWHIAVALLCIAVLLSSPRIKAVFPVKDWNVGVFGAVVFGGYSLTFLLVIIFLL